MAISFDAPPLVEVVLGRTFLPRPDFLVPYFGGYWDRIKGEFPSVAHAAPITAPGENFVSADEGYWLPRVWLMSSDNVRLVQLQQDRFHFNWRKTPEMPDYVRFPAIQKVACDLWDSFNAYVFEVTQTPLQPLSNELTYTNVIAETGLTAFEIAKIALRDSVWCQQDRFLGTPKALSHTYSFAVPDSVGDLSVTIVTGLRPSDNAAILKIELTVKGKQHETRSLESWSTQARDFLVASFKDLTTPEMHTKWKLRNE